MANLRPWIAVAGLGALHGLNPASGWMFAADCGLAQCGAGGLLVGTAPRRAWTAALAVTGVLLMAWR